METRLSWHRGTLAIVKMDCYSPPRDWPMMVAIHFTARRGAVGGPFDSRGDGPALIRGGQISESASRGEFVMPTSCESMIRHVLRDEALTRGLGDIEGRMLIEWLTDWAELLASASRTEEEAWGYVHRLCRRGRAISRFVQLWSDPRSRGAANQLAASERFDWPLPASADAAWDPADLMEHILEWERSLSWD